jgi:pilus assembly protein Flp/PilA
MFKTKSKRQQKGQGLVEYALILMLVAVVVIAVLLILGPMIGNVFSGINNSLVVDGASAGGVSTAGASWSCANPTTQSACLAKSNPCQDPSLTYSWENGSEGLGCYYVP